jgi:hypothetical protein
MLKTIIIMGAIALGANVLLIWYMKRRKPIADFKQSRINTMDLGASPQGILKIKQGRKLIQSAATELGISVEELDNMTFKEIMELAK